MPEVSGEAIVAEARSWLGTPFRHQGRLKGVACDCIGLVIEVARSTGALEAGGLPGDYDVRDYAAAPGTFRMLERFTEHCDPLPLHNARPGHIAVFAVRHIVSHCGILGDHPGGGLTLIHALEAHVPTRRRGQGRRSVIEHRFIGVWTAACVKVFTMPGGWESSQLTVLSEDEKSPLLSLPTSPTDNRQLPTEGAQRPTWLD